MRKDASKTAKLSEEEQSVAKKMIEADITKDIPLSGSEWQNLVKLLGESGTIISFDGRNTTVVKGE